MTAAPLTFASVVVVVGDLNFSTLYAEGIISLTICSTIMYGRRML